jgi:hypothetical protein
LFSFSSGFQMERATQMSNNFVVVFTSGSQTIVDLPIDPDRHTRAYVESCVVEMLVKESRGEVPKEAIAEIRCYGEAFTV